jgi:nicotinamidase-related amidase
VNTQLLIVDPQNDFCDFSGAALPVAGAHADLLRLSDFVATQQAKLDGITVTLDSHSSVAVERTTFWTTQQGEPVAAFTFITAADVMADTYMPRNRSLKDQVVAMLEQLAQRGRTGLVVWPVHCVTGTWGHNIHDALAARLNAWEFAHQRTVLKVLKGEYPLTEHFGAFEADAPLEGVASTQFNTRLAIALTQGVDLLLIAGEASSHCVAASFDQLAGFLATQPGSRPRMVLLRDCMSPVPGFEGAADQLFERARAFGADILTTAQAQALLA